MEDEIRNTVNETSKHTNPIPSKEKTAVLCGSQIKNTKKESKRDTPNEKREILRIEQLYFRGSLRCDDQEFAAKDVHQAEKNEDIGDESRCTKLCQIPNES